MTTKKRIYAVSILVVLIIAAVVFAISPYGFKKNEELMRVSMIVYGNDASRWEKLRQGAELAFSRRNVDITLVTTASEVNADEQMELISRELEDDVDAIMIVPCDSNRLEQYMAERKPRVPVVVIESGTVEGSKLDSVSVDDYEVGKALGQELIKRENPIVTVAIISDGTEKESVRLREQGLREVIEPYANRIITWSRNDNEKDMIKRKFLQRAILERAVDVVVALDNESADSLMDALDNLNKQRKVYAVSTSDKSVYYLDRQKIKALVYPTEFGMGYMGAQYVLDSKKAAVEYRDTDVQYCVISKENMYDKDVQKLIFPMDK